ncbi:MAG: sulfite exporter TauE/SafE family protein [Clostridiales bacterium]|nr:sulfite exporter TauE/SafE family protein [Clostridiales bacterium]
MGFIYFLIAGFLGGLLGGMGMGGGTILIPLLTVFLGVEQHIAQAANLIAFLPMALISLNIHKKEGLLKTNGAFVIIIPAVIFSVLGSMLAVALPANILKKLLGAFLIALAIKRAKVVISSLSKKSF